jgi:hypothetical protein
MVQDKNPIDELSRILAELGQAPEGVAAMLRASGCRGFQRGNFPSPVIRYAYRQFDDGNIVLVYSPPPELRPAKLYLYRLDGRREELSLPSAVAEFLARFDAGAYPDLDLALIRRTT